MQVTFCVNNNGESQAFSHLDELPPTLAAAMRASLVNLRQNLIELAIHCTVAAQLGDDTAESATIHFD